jgi:hypothetical protein
VRFWEILGPTKNKEKIGAQVQMHTHFESVEALLLTSKPSKTLFTSLKVNNKGSSVQHKCTVLTDPQATLFIIKFKYSYSH